MKSITKLPRALLNATLGRGRNRLPRLVLLAVLVGITLAIYHQLSQQNIALKNIPEDEGILKVREYVLYPVIIMKSSNYYIIIKNLSVWDEMSCCFFFVFFFFTGLKC